MTAPDFAAILREHRQMPGGRNLGQYRTERDCSCGATYVNDGHKDETPASAHTEHVAAVLQAAVREWLGDGSRDESDGAAGENSEPLEVKVRDLAGLGYLVVTCEKFGIEYDADESDGFHLARAIHRRVAALLAPDRGSEAQG